MTRLAEVVQTDIDALLEEVGALADEPSRRRTLIDRYSAVLAGFGRAVLDQAGDLGMWEAAQGRPMSWGSPRTRR